MRAILRRWRAQNDLAGDTQSVMACALVFVSPHAGWCPSGRSSKKATACRSKKDEVGRSNVLNHQICGGVQGP
jgi:hypothetical protein